MGRVMSLLKESGFCFLQLWNPRDESWEYAWPPTRQSFQNGQGNRTFYKWSHCLKINLSKAHVFVYICPFWGADSSSGWCKVTTTECQGTNWLSVEWRLPSSSALFNRVTNVIWYFTGTTEPFHSKEKEWGDSKLTRVIGRELCHCTSRDWKHAGTL